MNNLSVVITATVTSPSNLKSKATLTTNASFEASSTVNISNNIKAVSTGIINGTGTSDHSKLRKLTYEESGHTGFASQKQLEKYAKTEELPQSLSNLEIENILK